ncbi:MAG: glycoside hydrolase family 2 protein [Provencibacterium sp.]|jgi:beta-mannosidase|nr:glycoside hydrolase family 2 protein [Provencibacterium sp.]
MQKLDLGGRWELTLSNGTRCSGSVPGSVYSFLLENGQMENPHWRENELAALQLITENDFTFSRQFTLPESFQGLSSVLLRCEGLDTVCSVWLNGIKIGDACNMHRTFEFEAKKALIPGENRLEIRFVSPVRHIREEVKKDYIGGSYHAMVGFPLLRKAHCMFGWDWGPRLPDGGIWRDISLLGVDSSRIEDVHITQRHQDGEVFLKVAVTQSGSAKTQITLLSPDGRQTKLLPGEEMKVENPQLWWPNGYGPHPLYTVRTELMENGKTVDRDEKRIGLRTMSVVREKDEWGESFAQCVNGVQIFAMGADYIPEDNLLSRITPERTRNLLLQCVRANFNSVRVWGGGYYPDDWFYDACDELGLVVWQDFMFACANYHLTESFEENIEAEFADNIRRLRHHPSLGLWCGNNEMEMFQATGEYDGTPRTRSDYIRMFEHIIPHKLRELDPDTFYWPASPSSGGGFDEPNSPDRGDVHYWEVWHGGKPFSDYRNYYFRYASEFGFQSFPCLKTVESFTEPDDRNIFSRVMERHQRNEGANGKIMLYLSQTFLYPNDFDTLLYASQLLQAEAIRYGVEHWRRNRGRCMGAIYWQLNDIWPVASWASVDYYGRWKALHYYARRFFAPLMISCEETGETTRRVSIILEPSSIETSVRLSVANETREDRDCTVCWALRSADGSVIKSGETPVHLPALTSVWLDRQVFEGVDFLSTYFSFSLTHRGECVSAGTVLFTAPKHFHFLDPQLSVSREGDTITVFAAAYAKSVEISSPDSDLILSDNYFDMNAGRCTVKILEGDPKELSVRSVYNIR